MDTRVAEGWILAELIHAVWLSAAARQRFIAGAILRAGSHQRDDSIGSSLKLTKSDTSTAAATVMPN